MSDELKSPGNMHTSPLLGRIAQALGVPVSRFSTKDGTESQMGGHLNLDDAAVLALVRAYLQGADPATRRHFVASVTALVDELSL